MNEYLLSIVIPTKNRQEYAIQAIKEILNTTTDEVEIVIQDNSISDSLKYDIEKLGQNRILYHYSPENLSFVDNFEKAVELANGEYMILIGDDDGILPSITKITHWAKDNNYDAITSKILVTYYWPNSGAKNYKCSENNGYIRINDYSNNIENIDVRKNLIKVIKNGCQFYHSSKIPKIYHGIVKTKIIQNIIKEQGALFAGLSPDIYSAILISLYVNKVVCIDSPFTIDGNCKKSGAGAQAQGKHSGSLKNAPHFNGHDNYQWNSKVPYVYSIQTIWADSALAALENMNEKSLLELFSTEKITAYTMLNNKSIRKETFQQYMNITHYSILKSNLKILFSSINGPLTNYISRIIKRIMGCGQVGHIINDISNIEIAEQRIQEYIETKGEFDYDIIQK